MSGALELLGGARTSLIVTVGMTGEDSEETEADSLETLDMTLTVESVERTEADSSMTDSSSVSSTEVTLTFNPSILRNLFCF